jgi:hypothetical protein
VLARRRRFPRGCRAGCLRRRRLSRTSTRSRRDGAIPTERDLPL